MAAALLGGCVAQKKELDKTKNKSIRKMKKKATDKRETLKAKEQARAETKASRKQTLSKIRAV